VREFLWGATALGCWIAGLFFLRFRRETGDRFFSFFALAFWALALNWLGLAITAPADEARTYFYLVRLLAFLLIIAAVADKNRAGR
jgi:hypothetical protein